MYTACISTPLGATHIHARVYHPVQKYTLIEGVMVMMVIDDEKGRSAAPPKPPRSKLRKEP